MVITCERDWSVVDGFIFFPFLNTGQMFAVFHMAGIVPDSYDILNMTASIGAMNGASSLFNACTL
jgi:hypothetical protein